MENTNYLIPEEEGIDFRKWFFLILRNWYFFLICLVVACSIAFVYNYTATEQFEISAKVLIKESKNPLDKENLISVSLYSNPYQLENEIGILGSSGLIRKSILDLDFFVDYFSEKNFKKKELYHTAPFKVIFDSLYNQPVGVDFEIVYLSDSLISIEVEAESVSLYDFTRQMVIGRKPELYFVDTIRIGEWFYHDFARFCIVPVERNMEPGFRQSNYSFKFRSLHSLINQYRNIEVSIPNGSSIMDISLKSSNLPKAAMYLNKLLQNYILKGTERENEIAERTIEFIDLQLITLVDSLRISEQLLENFRSDNRLVDIDIQVKQAYERQIELERKRAELILQSRYLDYLKDNLQSDSISFDELVAPSTMGIKDAVLNNLVLELVNLHNERTELTLNTRKNTPYISSIDMRIESLKFKLIETVEYIFNTTILSLEEIEEQNKLVSERLSKLPKEQRELLKFERKFQFNDEIYTYLLTRRSEMQINKASNVPANEILEEPDVLSARIVQPNRKINFMIALFLGLFFPLGILYLRDVLNDRVQSQDDIKIHRDFPVIGTVLKSDHSEIPSIVHHPDSFISEAFRMLRANMQFVISDKVPSIIVVTSAMKGEGKSFTAVNYAAVCATYDKKVCLVDLDLRRPKIASYLNIETNKGMSNYLIGKAGPEEIVYSACDGLFDIIPSGPIPPNPSELIAAERLFVFIESLKAKYDRIIIDSPPIGMISDAMFISKLSQTIILVVRHNVTNKTLLESILQDFERNNQKGIKIVFNDLPTSGQSYYRYNYRYSQEGQSFFSKLVNRYR
jgi:capsular exopolysaccharide synthesis family protein